MGIMYSSSNADKYSRIFNDVPTGSTDLTNPEKTNVAPTTNRANTTSVGCMFRSHKVRADLFTIFDLYQSEKRIIYHIHIIGIYAFRNLRNALMILDLFGSAYFHENQIGI